jgi:hypothetical protein
LIGAIYLLHCAKDVTFLKMRTVFSYAPLVMPESVSEQYTTLLKSLQIREDFPEPTEVHDISADDRNVLVVVEDRITIAALHRHLQDSADTTSEISVNIFEDGTQLLQVGTIGNVAEVRGWSRILDFSRVDFHSHPGDCVENQHLRYPSFQDMQYSKPRLGMTVVGSSHGLCEVPALGNDIDLDALWEEYIVNVRGFDEYTYNRYEGSIFSEFMEQVVTVHEVELDRIDPRLWLSDLSGISWL